MTLLHLATYCAKVDLMEVLLKHGADAAARPEPRFTTPSRFGGDTPLHILLANAASHPKSSVENGLKLLLNHDWRLAELRIGGGNGKTPQEVIPKARKWLGPIMIQVVGLLKPKPREKTQSPLKPANEKSSGTDDSQADSSAPDAEVAADGHGSQVRAKGGLGAG
eukprot:gene21902-28944_t